MRKILSAIFGGLNVDRTTEDNEWPDRRIRELVSDFSNGDPEALSTARRMLDEGLPLDDFGDEIPEDMKVFGILETSLGGSGRLISLDWKEELSDVEDAFSNLFAKFSLDACEAREWLRDNSSEDGDDVGAAYVAFRRVADAAGMRITSIDTNSDAYHFVLTGEKQAERWKSVSIGPHQRIEDADWQFETKLEAVGMTVRSRDHSA